MPPGSKDLASSRKHIEDCIAEGRSINVTLIFSLERHAAVIEAYLRGLERLVASGGDPTRVASVASFFVSRVDTEADRRLEELGRPDVQGRLAVANAKLAYAQWRETFSGERWERLAAAGARTQRCLWASTSTKNPEYRDVLYVESLIGPDTVNTMPQATMDAFRDHGHVDPGAVSGGLDEAEKVLVQLEEAGVSLEAITAQLVDGGREPRIGDPVTAVFRRLYEEEGVLRYCFKFRPAQAAVTGWAGDSISEAAVDG